MRAISIAAAAAALLLAASTFVPLRAAAGASADHAAAAAKGKAQSPLAQQDVSKIIGTTVYDSKGDEIGDIATVLMDPETRKIDRFVVRVLVPRAGGIFGVGGHLVALPIGAFSWNAKKPGFAVAMSAQALKSMTAWTDSAQPAQVTAGSGSTAKDTTAPASATGH